MFYQFCKNRWKTFKSNLTIHTYAVDTPAFLCMLTDPFWELDSSSESIKILRGRANSAVIEQLNSHGCLRHKAQKIFLCLDDRETSIAHEPTAESRHVSENTAFIFKYFDFYSQLKTAEKCWSCCWKQMQMKKTQCSYATHID